jgi:hypothetical protein
MWSDVPASHSLGIELANGKGQDMLFSIERIFLQTLQDIVSSPAARAGSSWSSGLRTPLLVPLWAAEF